VRSALHLGLAMLCPALLLIPGFKAFLEASMYTHMLVLYPGLIASGFLVGRLSSRSRIAGNYASVDAHGVLTVAIVTALGAFWMIPTALDFAVFDSVMGLARTLSLLLTGLVLAWRYKAMPGEMLIFLAGNSAWMLTTAGALISSSELRLCVSYLYEDQLVTGIGLSAYGCLIGALAVARALRTTPEAEKAAQRS